MLCSLFALSLYNSELAKEEVPSPSNSSRKEEVTASRSSKEHVDGPSHAVVANLSSIDDSMERSHVHEMPQAPAISQNTYVREMFQNEGMSLLSHTQRNLRHI